MITEDDGRNLSANYNQPNSEFSQQFSPSFGQSPFYENPSSTDYELNNKHTKFNTTLKKIMEETILDTESDKEIVIATTATETSDSDSSGESKLEIGCDLLIFL